MDNLIAEPIVSIIILTYNNLEYTRQCVESVLQLTHEPAYEMILVDNASTDGTQDYLRGLEKDNPNIHAIFNKKNEGFARGNNKGAAIGRGQYLVFLNNDTIVTHGWLQGLISKLADPKVGMIGPVTNSSGNETRIKVDYSSIEDLPEFARRLSEAHQGSTFEVSMLAFLCVAIRRAVFDEIGPLDERFGIGMFEDDDYALRLKAKGYKILCAEDVFVHHWGSASFSQMDASEYWGLFHNNLKLYEEKWGVRWLPHPNRIEFIPEQLRNMVDGLIALSAKAEEYYQQVLNLQQLVRERDEYLAENAKKIEVLSGPFAQWVIPVLLRLMPPNSWRERMLTKLFLYLKFWEDQGSFGLLRFGLTRLAATPIARKLGQLVVKILPGRWKDYYHAYRQEYTTHDRSQVIVFTNDDNILPDYPHRQPLALPGVKERVKISLISTVRNEAKSVESWLNSLLKQSRLPNEIIISDGGSTDQTVALIRKHAESFPIPIQLIEAPGANISRGRNIAIQHVSNDVIACTDFGCELDKDWLHNLILPFESGSDIDVSYGFSLMLSNSNFSKIASQYFVPEINQVNLQQFIPSARNFAMRKQVWEQADGYPEYLTYAGEDTLFTLNAKLQNRRWAFVPQAIVHWHGPTNLRRLYRTIYRYARGDGEVGMLAHLYWSKVKELAWGWFRRLLGLLLLVGLCILASIFIHPLGGWYLAGLIVLIGSLSTLSKLQRLSTTHQVGMCSALQAWLMPQVINLAQSFGFAAGVANRKTVRQRQTDIYVQQLHQIIKENSDSQGVIVYPPTHDWGFMFQRPHQMARAFAHQGYTYLFYTLNEKTDSVIGFRQVEPRLYLCNVPWETFGSLDNPIVYIGQPWRNRELPYFKQPRVIYDHYDEIEIFSADPADHQALLKRAEIVLVTASRLMEKIKDQRPDAIFAPNGVDYQLVQSARPSHPIQSVPRDLQPILTKDKPIIGYSGALAEWFDYELLVEVAKGRPDLEFLLIGVSYDGSLERSGLMTCGLDNIHWLDMKPYKELFAYVWRFTVGIIPFKINEITLSTTPVKLFEYMACELPVVTTAMPEVRNYQGVFIAESGEDGRQSATNFIAQLNAALLARQDANYQALIHKVAIENTWTSRVQAIIERLNQNTHK